MLCALHYSLKAEQDDAFKNIGHGTQSLEVSSKRIMEESREIPKTCTLEFFVLGSHYHTELAIAQQQPTHGQPPYRWTKIFTIYAKV